MESKIRKDEAAWKQQLTQNQYFVTRQKGTEPAFTGEYEDTETPGTYKCVWCGQPLFRSEAKYPSGSGWPSFYAPASEVAAWGAERPAPRGAGGGWKRRRGGPLRAALLG